MKSMFATAMAAAGVAASVEINSATISAFENFMEKYDKKYSTEEFTQRLSIFAENVALANERNAEHILLGGEAVHGITKFMDLSPEEFKSMYLTYTPREIADEDRVTPPAVAATDYDWRDKNAVTAVKDQGRCGSCWAFSAVETIESFAFLAGQPLQVLSEQQVNSCDKTDGGCNGGNTETAYRYIESAGGLVTEKEYPYTSGSRGVTGTCDTSVANGPKAVSIRSYHSVSKGETNLLNSMALGPVSVCVAANAFQTYRSGILKSCPGFIDHCVQAVGFKQNTGGDPYWIVRNSWATSWGEQGYIRIEYGQDLCRIADDVTYPTF